MQLNDLGNEWTGKVYVYWNARYGWLQVSDHADLADEALVLLGESTEITVPFISRDEVVSKRVSALRNEQQRVLAESQRAVNRIEGQIHSLLAIEHKPEA